MTGYFQSWATLQRAQLWMILLMAVAVVAANVDQPYPDIAPLQHIPTILLIAASAPLLRRWPLSNAALGCIAGFFLLHTLAGRYTYSNVPYDLWARTVFGISIDKAFDLERNDFDRVVHLSFGLLSIRPFWELATRRGAMTPRAAAFSAFLFVGAVSALYEIFEWLLTLVMAPEMADEYNGQQGDVWDSQKDMAIAIVGSLLGLSIGGWRGRRSAARSG